MKLIEQKLNCPYYNVTVATPVKFEDTSIPILITNDPVVKAGEGFKTLSKIIVTLDIAEAVKVELLIINVLVPLSDTERMFVTIASFIMIVLILGSFELSSTY